LLQLPWQSGKARKCIELIHSRSLVFSVAIAPFPQMNFTESLVGLLPHFCDKSSWDFFWQLYIFRSGNSLRLGADIFRLGTNISISFVSASDDGLGTYRSVEVEGSISFMSTF
jgi:hypothetical protein